MSDAADMAMERESGDWTDDREETMAAYGKETMNQIRKAAAAAAKPAKKSAKKRAGAYKRQEKAETSPAAAKLTPKANKLELLLKSITEKYPKDPSAPGLAISFLPGKPYASFYGSIRRFEGYGGTKPMVIASCSRNSLLEVMNCLAEKWREHVRPMETTATEEFLKLT